jgi:hypothetical protein
MTFDDHNEAQLFMDRTKPPAGKKWAIYPIEIDEGEYSDAVMVKAEERWPIDGPLNKPDKWTLESGDPIG